MRIVAEVGSNWHSLSDIMASIKTAKETGADVVKFQLFNNKEMYSDVPNLKVGVSPYLDPSWLLSMAAYAKGLDIEFMCTAFSPDGYALVDKYVEIHKIASAEITDNNILDKVNSLKKPVYLSTGGASLEQIKNALDRLKLCPVTIFYCVTEYPAKLVDFRHLDKLVETFKRNYHYGYSDHSIDILTIPVLAKYRGCTVIEKHVNFTSHTDTDDAPHALNAQDFSLMVRSIHGDPIDIKDTVRGCYWQRKAEGDSFFRQK